MMIRMTLAALLAASLAFAGCGSSTSSSGGTTTTTDTATGDDTAVTDTTAGTDAASGDTATKDVGKDTVKADIGAPKITWGECVLTDTPCLQGCVQTNCMDANQACAGNADCAAYQKCQQGCYATPVKLPEQATPIAQLPAEDTQTYCNRVCSEQATGEALALDQAYISCIIGYCIDCNQSSSGGITKSQCQAACGQENFCLDPLNACLGDTDCLSAFGCLFKCDNGDAACQNACITSAKGQGGPLFKTFNDCVTANATKCVAP